ncbi:hypothetical protein EVAR_39111_1 [Eumeta japonica]|uniref:Uncharacterized protein n=1 Tax=Eumeta variegata TaxID=151549 RepID=A0A4C1X6A4_EUMVA|nr:hypothetical protein EVAR_39111_1 [Eumeta japonica]
MAALLLAGATVISVAQDGNCFETPNFLPSGKRLLIWLRIADSFRADYNKMTNATLLTVHHPGRRSPKKIHCAPAGPEARRRHNTPGERGSGRVSLIPKTETLNSLRRILVNNSRNIFKQDAERAPARPRPAAVARAEGPSWVALESTR